MKSIIFLLIINIYYINTKTLKYPPYCNEADQNDPREKRNQSAGYVTDKQGLDQKLEVNDQTSHTEASKEAIETGNYDSPNNVQTYNNNVNNEKLLPVANESNENVLEKDDDEIANDNQKNASQENTADSLLSNGGPYLNKIKIKQPEYTFPNRKSQSFGAFDDDDDDDDNDKEKNPNDIFDNDDAINKDLLKYTDINNVRQVREHLLDHLLDYFLNIIKEDEQNTVTRKKNGKDKMKVEDRLRNYYSPDHIDEVIYINDTDFHDLDPGYFNGRRKGDNLLNKNDDVSEITTTIRPKDIHNNTQDNEEQTEFDKPQKLENMKKQITDSVNTNSVTTYSKIVNIETTTNDAVTEVLPKLKDITTPMSNIVIDDINTEEDIETQTEEPEQTTEISQIENQTQKSLEIEISKPLEAASLIEHETDSTEENDDYETTPAEILNNNLTEESIDITNKEKREPLEIANLTKSVALIKENELLDKNKNVGTRRTNNPNDVDITKTIIIQSKDCADEHSVSEAQTKEELAQEKCKNNIILQFNINI